MKPTNRRAALLLTAGLLLTTAVVPALATAAGGRGGPSWSRVDSRANTSLDRNGLQSDLSALPKTTLTASDRASLAFMREEEKLALDVYTVLGAKTKLTQFANIAKAEATHSAAVKTLLDRYGLKDPAAKTAPGKFANAELQALYTKLVTQGSVSSVDALKVGALIEEIDIADLQKRKSAAADIDLVYSNLEKGSRNHLRAFVSALYFQGVTYVPTVLNRDAYDAIITAPVERGPSS